MTPVCVSAEAFFLPGLHGQLFCMFYPAQTPSVRGNCFYVHPFAEELNKTRRMAALYSSMLALAGFNVLQLDLYGCGDSEGDWRNIRQDTWRSDIHCGVQWLQKQCDQPLMMWGLRLGASLAVEYLTAYPGTDATLLLWQPVIKGENHLNQFLRLRLAAQIQQQSKDTVALLRSQLRQGEILEIAGYAVTSELLALMDAMEINQLPVGVKQVYWAEVVATSALELTLPSKKVISQWRAEPIQIQAQVVVGQSFWATQEIAVAESLIDMSLQWLAQ